MPGYACHIRHPDMPDIRTPPPGHTRFPGFLPALCLYSIRPNKIIVKSITAKFLALTANVWYVLFQYLSVLIPYIHFFVSSSSYHDKNQIFQILLNSFIIKRYIQEVTATARILLLVDIMVYMPYNYFSLQRNKNVSVYN